MNSFIVQFFNEQQSAVHEIEASNPEEALKQARQIATDDPYSLEYEPYEEFCPIGEIQVLDEDENVVAHWYDDELRLRIATSELLAAAEKVVARWERGDLAEAVRELGAAVTKAKEGPA
jgi:hypothetical protein